VTNGTDLEKFYNSKKNNKRVIFSGAMYHHRGIDVLLNCASQVIDQINDVEFLLLGDGPEMTRLREFVNKNNLSKNIIFKGWVQREKIPEFLATSSIGIGPLRITDVTKGALPIKVLEYMASSLPILAMKETLPEDILKDEINGYAITDSNELAQKIIHILKNDDLREQMGGNSNKMVQKFDWKNVAESIINEFRSINS
jgi:1,2-diacylglycerol 3-alpha-glucosyltransferase